MSAVTNPVSMDTGALSTLNKLLTRYDQVCTQRRTWEYHWQELRDLVNPHGIDFNRVQQPGARKTDLIFDGTAVWALEQLTAGLHSFLTSPSDRWFNLCVHNYDYMNDAAALTWLEQVSDIIYQCYCDAKTNFNDSFHEAYTDLGGFGTAVVYQYWDADERRLVFRTYPLADCRIMENSSGYVDCVWRDVKMTTRQILQEWPNPEDHGDVISKEKNMDAEWKVVHAVFPRADRDRMKLNGKNKKFASFYFCQTAKAVFSESGYDEFPYHAVRWAKRTGEIYGRPPGMTCLPDIKMLQAMEKAMIRSIQKIVDPPLLVPNDGFMLPIETTPASLIFYDNSTGDNNMIKPLETKAQIQVGEDKLQQKREYVMKCFYADWLQRTKKKERQTATEVSDDRNEMLQMMAPILGRLQAELLGPGLSRSYNLLNAAGMIPPAPFSLRQRKLHIEYVSPAAVAQYAAKGVAVKAFVEDMTQLAQAIPDVIDNIDPDGLTEQMALTRNISRKILRSTKDVKKIRDQRQKAQAAQQAAETAQPAAGAAKDMATAQEKGLDPSAMMQMMQQQQGQGDNS